jgi:hypothetical protein
VFNHGHFRKESGFKMVSEKVNSALRIMLEGYGRRITEPMVTAYSTALDRLDDSDCCRACKQAIIELEYCPSPAQLRGIALSYRPPARTTTDHEHRPPTQAERARDSAFAKDFIAALFAGQDLGQCIMLHYGSDKTNTKS